MPTKTIVAIQKNQATGKPNKITIGNLIIQLTYDPDGNVSTFTFKGNKADFPSIADIAKIIANISSVWDSGVSITDILAANAIANANAIRTTIATSGGTISLIQGPAIDHLEASATLNPVLTSAPINGNMLFACLGMIDPVVGRTVSSIVQTGVSWSKVINKTVNNAGYFHDVEIWIGVVSAGALTSAIVHWSGASAGSYNIVDICEFSGVSNTLDVTASASGSSVTIDTGTTAATAQASELLIGATYNNGFTGPQEQNSPTNSFTLLDGYNWQSSNSLGFCYKIQTAIGTANVSTTALTNTGWCGCIATFKSK